MPNLLNLLPFLSVVVPLLWLVWFLLTSLNRVTRSLEDIAVTLRRMERRTDAGYGRQA